MVPGREVSNSEVILSFSFKPIGHVENKYREDLDTGGVDTLGVLASRCPTRPNNSRLTTVKLLTVEGNTLYVTGLDAISGTPVLDINPFSEEFDGVRK